MNGHTKVDVLEQNWTLICIKRDSVGDSVGDSFAAKSFAILISGPSTFAGQFDTFPAAFIPLFAHWTYKDLHFDL